MAKKINYEKLYTQRKDGRWQGYYYDERGNRHAVTARTAEEVHLKIEEKTAPKQRTFKDAADEWERVRRQEVTVRTWANYAPHVERLVKLYGDCAVTDVNGAMIAADLERLKAQNFSRTSVNTRRVVWSGILRNEVILGSLQFNPADSIRLPKNLPHSVRRALTDDEMKKILHGVDAPFGFFAFFLLCSGLRKSEALALTWGDIDLKAREISVTKSLEFVSTVPQVKAPKTEAGVRTVPIIDVLADELAKRKSRRKMDLLFPAGGGNRAGAGGGFMTERGYEVAWKRYCDAVGLTGLTAHNLRHGTATMLFEAGVDAETAQHILGHSKVSTTLDIYTELRNAKLKKDATKLNDVMAALMAKS